MDRLSDTIKRLGNGALVDLEAAVQCFVLDVSGRVAFDIDTKATTDLHGSGAKIADYITQGTGSDGSPVRSPELFNLSIVWMTCKHGR